MTSYEPIIFYADLSFFPDFISNRIWISRSKCKKSQLELNSHKIYTSNNCHDYSIS